MNRPIVVIVTPSSFPPSPYPPPPPLSPLAVSSSKSTFPRLEIVKLGPCASLQGGLHFINGVVEKLDLLLAEDGHLVLPGLLLPEIKALRRPQGAFHVGADVEELEDTVELPGQVRLQSAVHNHVKRDT